MSRAIVTLAIGSLNGDSQSNKIDFHLVKEHFDNSETSSVVDEDSDKATGIIALDTNADEFDGCANERTTGQPVQFQPLTQEETSITVKGAIFNDISFDKSSIQASANHFNVNCTISSDKLQATGTWQAIAQFRSALKYEVQQYVESKRTQMVSEFFNSSATASIATKVQLGVQQVSMLSNDVLALMEKCAVYANKHLKYNVSSGSVTIECPGDDEAATAIADEFQTQYRQLMMGGKLKEHSFPVPSNYSKQQVDQLISQYNNEFSQSILKLDQKLHVIKCLSTNARQMNHIKAKIKESFQQPAAITPSTGVDTHTSMSLSLPEGRRVTLKQADITQEVVDAIVNAANDKLVHGGGVAFAINKASNGAVQQQSTAITRQHGLLQVGQAVHTGAGGALKCKYVIHTVGPEQYKHKDKSQELLFMACMNTLQLAEKLGVTSLAIPPISSGIFGVPKDVVAKTIISAVCQYPCHPGRLLTDVRIVIVDDSTFKTFKQFFIDARASITTDDQPHMGPPAHTLPINLFHSLPDTHSQGYQPNGCTMTHAILRDAKHRIPGYEYFSTIMITYKIPSGTQGPNHPNPGKHYTGKTYYAYLPNSSEGKQVLELLEKAFNARMTFTIGKNNKVTWNGIHHKTNMHGGYQKYGYPDQKYLERIKDELQIKLGIITIV